MYYGIHISQSVPALHGQRQPANMVCTRWLIVLSGLSKHNWLQRTIQLRQGNLQSHLH